jgi:hypothetical protein
MVFCWRFKVNDENSRIGSVPKCHRSATLIICFHSCLNEGLFALSCHICHLIHISGLYIKLFLSTWSGRMASRGSTPIEPGEPGLWAEIRLSSVVISCKKRHRIIKKCVGPAEIRTGNICTCSQSPGTGNTEIPEIVLYKKGIKDINWHYAIIRSLDSQSLLNRHRQKS